MFEGRIYVLAEVVDKFLIIFFTLVGPRLSKSGFYIGS